MKLIKVLSFICALCFALALVGFSGAWGEETFFDKAGSYTSTFTFSTAPQYILFCAPGEDGQQEEVGRLSLTDPMTFVGRVDASAELFFNYFLRHYKLDCKKEVK